ncbi:benzoate/toluate 1,2-dioxygenase reductase subunit [Azospirillum lipoferum]|uniref:Ring-hydroxylating dioxygenase ferredoxin reductase family protein n=1 Tax=Azospirillum lipoferum TaxID=193 RepID=A0A5A9GKN0_AZOLI|nr:MULTISPECIES: benzoate 1,2-dioxygenase electron transfer component BenC [Azospirillum]KAA0594981.1 ring-hydroxylating dioxygenase ferredoxin reductase family protein [Azospirillum lipoferum]MCP1612679.1 benzoate/toluate 1,2-dioxygenase reductase subunit [Azospirillum lipoferum]MDW5532181.1 benzoate 1,2-dioxygenase electron transfer component BenC [Azospirillum sp. NL1]
MSFQIALTFEDGPTRFIEAHPGETVADAAYRQGINIPLDCRDGACGTCKSFCEAGRYDGGSYIEDALTDAEAAEGYCLTCQMRPASDLTLRIAASSDLCKTKAMTVAAEVAAVERLSDSALSLALRLDGNARLSFLPGQYVNIEVPGSGQTRSYSFSSPPGAEVATFLIRNVPGGLMSGYLTDRAKPGDRLTLGGPFGSFYLRDLRRPVLMLAGGTGLAPFLSMLGRIAAMEGGSPQPVHLVYGVTLDRDLVEVEALRSLADRCPGFTFATCVADPDSRHPLTGYVTHHLRPEHLNGGDVDVYLCGPPPMVEAVRGHFRDQGIAPASFHYEKFSASEGNGR